MVLAHISGKANSGISANTLLQISTNKASPHGYRFSLYPVSYSSRLYF